MGEEDDLTFELFLLLNSSLDERKKSGFARTRWGSLHHFTSLLPLAPKLINMV